MLATNTSYLDIDAIAAVTSRPQDVIGLHFFSPANIMKLLEIVVPSKVAPDVVVTSFELAKRMKKVPVRAGVCDGFIGNRILSVYREGANVMLEDGASPTTSTPRCAVRHPMGPFQVSDLAGGDIGLGHAQAQAPPRDQGALRRGRRPHRRARLVGQKTGRGWYLYPEGAHRPGRPRVLAIVDAERKKGITPRVHHDEIMRRYTAAMVNEGAKVLEGIALRPLDIDVTFCLATASCAGGGPDEVGRHAEPGQGLADIQEFARKTAVLATGRTAAKAGGRGQKLTALNQSPAAGGRTHLHNAACQAGGTAACGSQRKEPAAITPGHIAWAASGSAEINRNSGAFHAHWKAVIVVPPARTPS